MRRSTPGFSTRLHADPVRGAAHDFVSLSQPRHHPTSVTPDLTSRARVPIQRSLAALLNRLATGIGRSVCVVETTRAAVSRQSAISRRREEHNDFVHGEWAPHLVKQAVYLTNPSGTALLALAPFAEHHHDICICSRRFRSCAHSSLNDMSAGDAKAGRERRRADRVQVWLRQRANTALLQHRYNSSVFRLGTQETTDTEVDLVRVSEARGARPRGMRRFRVLITTRTRTRAEGAERDVAQDDTASSVWSEALNRPASGTTRS